MSDEDVKVSFGAQVTELIEGLGEAQAAVKESVEEMKAQIESLNATAEALMAPFAAIAGLLAGGEIFGEAIEKTASLAVNLEVMSQKTGMAVDEVSRLQYAADMSHVAAGQLETAIQRLARNMEMAATGGARQVADVFKQLSIATTDATGQLRPMQQILMDLAERFATMPDGTTKTAAAVTLLGRSGADLIPFLNQGKAGIEELEKEADKLGVTMNERDVSAAVAYEEAMKRLEGATAGVERQVVTGLMPALSSIASALTEGVKNTEAWHTLGEVVGGAFRVIATTATIAWTQMRMYFDVANAIVHLQNPWDMIKRDAENAVDTIKRLWSTVSEAPKPPALSGNMAPPVTHDLLQQLEAQWLQIKEMNRQNFGGLTQMELDFWKSKLSLAEAGSKEYLEIKKKIVDLEQQVDRNAYEGQLAMLKAKEDADKDDLAQVVRDRQAELDLIRQHYSEMSKEVQEGIARVTQAQAALQKDTEKQWKSAFDAIPTAFNEAVKGMSKNVGSMHELFAGFFTDLTKMSAAAGAATLRDHIATELAKRNITASTLAERVALESWAAIQSVARSAWAAMMNIGNYAAEAMAGAWAAVSSIPFVGPFIAPAVAVSAGAAVLALAGNLHSAAGGYDIPSGVNPMTQLHAQEMVLPAELANRIRTMSDNGGGGGGHHFHLQFVDTKGAERFIKTYAPHIVAATTQAVRDGRVKVE